MLLTVGNMEMKFGQTFEQPMANNANFFLALL